MSVSMAMTDTVTTQETLHMKLQPKVMAPRPPAGAKPKVSKLKVDPQRALEPARKKLSMVESQRIMAVLLDSIKRSQIVNAIPYIIDNIDRFRVVLGAELSQMLEEHGSTIQSFQELRDDTERILQREREATETAQMAKEEEQLATERDGDDMSQQSLNEYDDDEEDEDRPVSVSSQADMAMRNLGLVAHKMQHNCKNILRAFSLNPAAVIAVLKDGNPPQGVETKEIESKLNELKEILMQKLLTTPVEEMERNQLLRDLRDRELHNRGIITKLEGELQAAMDDRDEDIRKKKKVPTATLR